MAARVRKSLVMLQAFDHIATQDPNRFLLRYETQEYSYGQMRLEALALARAFQLQGIRPGSVIMMPAKMCPASVACILAAGYGGFSAMLFDSAKQTPKPLS